LQQEFSYSRSTVTPTLSHHLHVVQANIVLQTNATPLTSTAKASAAATQLKLVLSTHKFTKAHQESDQGHACGPKYTRQAVKWSFYAWLTSHDKWAILATLDAALPQQEHSQLTTHNMCVFINPIFLCK